jgi:transcriptional regulator with XRE-family HTH domain
LPNRRRGVLLDGSAIRRFREERGWSAQDLAQRADRSAMTVHNAEAAKLVDASTHRKIAEALSVSTEALLASEVDIPVPYRSVFISYGGPTSPLHEWWTPDTLGRPGIAEDDGSPQIATSRPDIGTFSNERGRWDLHLDWGPERTGRGIRYAGAGADGQ